MESVRGLFFNEAGRFVPGEIKYENGVITEVTELKSADLTESEKETKIIPGLVDIHSHGCFGHDTCDGKIESIKEMIAFEESRGITSYCPTTMTLDEESLIKAVTAVKEVALSNKTIKGIYLEGPFISLKKCGAQNPDFITAPDSNLIKRINEASGNLVKVVSIAPEVDGANDFISENAEKFCLTIAHTEADYDTAVSAISKGVKHITHFFNAMPAYTHRAPGVIGAAMDSDEVKVELIADGIHVHPAVVRNTFRQFGADRIILISDSMEATGLPDGKYSLGGQEVFVEGKTARLSNGTIAGSVSTLFDCMISAYKMGVPLEAAIISATKTPAIEVGIFDKVGSITVGKAADLVVLDSDLILKKVIHTK